MTEIRFSHRAAGLPGADPEKDRVVIYNPHPIACVRQIDQGQQEGLWARSDYWVSDDHRGLETSLSDALEAVKQRVKPETREALPPKCRGGNQSKDIQEWRQRINKPNRVRPANARSA